MDHLHSESAIRDALFEHEMFAATAGGSSFGLEHIRKIEATWPFESAAVESLLTKMSDEGLTQQTPHGYWRATRDGLLAREYRWQQLGRRHPVLILGTADKIGLVIALVASAGTEHELYGGRSLPERSLSIYLSNIGDEALNASVIELITRGLVKRSDPGFLERGNDLRLSADGRRFYAQTVVPLLGLCPPLTILAPARNEPLPFDDLGLGTPLADNLRFRWEEAARCMEARAWLAATALYGSILEVVLPDWLQRNEARARSAPSAPQGRSLPLEKWRLVDLIAVAAELDYIDVSLARHAQALRESRNLIHPDKNIRERSTPDSHLALISQQVVNAVLDALALNAKN